MKLFSLAVIFIILSTFIEEKLDPQTIHNWNFRRAHTCPGWVCGVIKRQTFATGIFKTEFSLYHFWI